MQSYGYLALLGPTSFDCGGGSSTTTTTTTTTSVCLFAIPKFRSSRRVPAASTIVHAHRNHYAVLGVPANASSSDIKRAYRLLALKYHPDVNKGLGADEAFKSIRLAYDILIDETMRTEYDQALQYQKRTGRSFGDEWAVNPDYEDGLKFYKWAYVRREMQGDRYRERYRRREEETFVCDNAEEETEEENLEEDRESFIEVLKSVFISLFLLQTVGVRLSLTFSTLMALTDRKLDGGYKFGYVVAWLMGGRGGILLTMFLSFACWVCGKTSSSVVALVVFAMWFGSNLARIAPIPQGALLTLLYMSIKLQVDLN